jgi:hypothetical protein
MERLAHLVEQLRTSVEAFKLREVQQYQIPRSSMFMNINDEPEKPLTISGVFRTVSAPLQPSGQNIRYQSTSGDSFPPPPPPPPVTANDYISYTPMPAPAKADNIQDLTWDYIPESEEEPDKWPTAKRAAFRQSSR